MSSKSRRNDITFSDVKEELIHVFFNWMKVGIKSVVISHILNVGHI